MLDWTDRHCRVLFRHLAPSARLYTEMVHANAVLAMLRQKKQDLQRAEPGK